MGILNVTPDSFSDGGQYVTLAKALYQAELLISQGAHILDVGGESTRPGAELVSEEEEKERVLPVLRSLRERTTITLSIDTQKAAVAQAAMAAGASIINDVSAGSDPQMPEVAAKTNATVVLMHRLGDAKTMQKDPVYPRGVVNEVKAFLIERRQRFIYAGVPAHKIWIDPGIGFGKDLEHNLELMRSLAGFVGIGEKLLIGTSRKSFLAHLMNNPQLPIVDREAGTLASNLWGYSQGVEVFRVHDVGSLVRGLATWQAIEGANQ